MFIQSPDGHSIVYRWEGHFRTFLPSSMNQIPSSEINLSFILDKTDDDFFRPWPGGLLVSIRGSTLDPPVPKDPSFSQQRSLLTCAHHTKLLLIISSFIKTILALLFQFSSQRNCPVNSVFPERWRTLLTARLFLFLTPYWTL